MQHLYYDSPVQAPLLMAKGHLRGNSYPAGKGISHLFLFLLLLLSHVSNGAEPLPQQMLAVEFHSCEGWGRFETGVPPTIFLPPVLIGGP